MATWVCGHCGERACTHPRQDRVALEGVSFPRRRDEWKVPAPNHPECACGHDDAAHPKGGPCVACRRCPKFRCPACQGQVCTCPPRWVGVSSDKAVKRCRDKLADASLSRFRITGEGWQRQLAQQLAREEARRIREEKERAGLEEDDALSIEGLDE